MPSETDQLSPSIDLNAQTEKSYVLACDPRRWLHRYFVLIFMCLLTFGSYFCYDTPGALQDTMKKDMKLSSTQYLLFYSLYSWPNVILCFFSGILLDKVFGICWGAIIFSLIVTFGQFLFASGAFFNTTTMMFIGRFIFGFGSESLAVAQNTYAVNWFEGRTLNMVFGLQLSFSRIGSTVGMISMQHIYNFISDKFNVYGHTCLGLSLFFATAFCLFSLFCAFMMGFFDKRSKRILKKDQEEKKAEMFVLSDLKAFGLPLWLLSGICVAYYVAIFPFISLGLVFFKNKYDMPEEASVVNSLLYILSACFSPIMGFCIDRTGKNLTWVFTGVLVTLACHCILAFTFISPYIPVIIMGIAYSILASALWPMVSLIIPRHQIGTAYGIMQSIQNLGLALVNLATGSIVDSKGYIYLETFFILWLCLAFLFTTILYFVDKTTGQKLNMSAKKRHREILNIQEEDLSINT